MAVDIGTKKQGGCPPPPPPKAFRQHPTPERPFPPPPPPPPFIPGLCCPPTNTLVLNNTIIKSVDDALLITEGYVHGNPAYFIEFNEEIVKPVIVGEDPIVVKEGVFTADDGTEKTGFLVTIKDMTGATDEKDGTPGIIPVPKIADKLKYLRGDGTWQTIPLPEVFTGATEQSDGTVGLVPAPSSSQKDYFLKADGTWAEIDIPEVPNMVGATAEQDGEAGIVPTPQAGDQNKYLSGDATWKDLPGDFTGATEQNNGENGMVPQPVAGDQNKYLSGDATWKDLPELRITEVIGSVSGTTMTVHVADLTYTKFSVGASIKKLVITIDSPRLSGPVSHSMFEFTLPKTTVMEDVSVVDTQGVNRLFFSPMYWPGEVTYQGTVTNGIATIIGYSPEESTQLFSTDSGKHVTTSSGQRIKFA